MNAIGKHFYLEDSYDGVVLGVVKLDHGLLLVDTPLRFSDQASWREKIMEFGEGVYRFILMLDPHIDRTMGLSALDGSVLGHESAAEILESRPASLRPHEIEAGAEAEALEQPLNVRWTLPDMSFSHSMALYSDETPVTITHRPGCHTAGCWARSDDEKIVFVGDSVLEHQPPFLAWSNLEIWLEELAELQSEPMRGYRIITSRNGIVRQETVEKLADFLAYLKENLDGLAGQSDKKEAIADLLPTLLRKINFDRKFSNLYRKRLAYGLTEYLKRQETLKNSEK
ncbi:MAG: hypothetical protein ACOCYU_05120 [Brevefilum sp.]